MIAVRPERAHERGFTVLEMLVALAILGVLAALAVSALDRVIAASRASGAISALRENINLVRARTVAQGTYWGICLRGAAYAGDDGRPMEMTLFAKPRPNDAPAQNQLTPLNAQFRREDDALGPRDRVFDQRPVAVSSGDTLEFSQGVAADGATTIMFDLMGRPWVFTGDSCDDDALTNTAGPDTDGPGWPNPVRFEIRVPERTDFAQTARRLTLTQNGTLTVEAPL